MICENYTTANGVLGGPCLHCGGSQPEHLEHLQRLLTREPAPALCTTNGEPVDVVRANQTEETGQHKGYIVLCPAERAKGFVRPYRDSYKHIGAPQQLEGDAAENYPQQVRSGGCGTVTTMGRALSETYARQPTFYSHTFCVHCNRHLPVAEFVWTQDGARVGS
jgi:hypothetical protein